jgi:hypothetical protein
MGEHRTSSIKKRKFDFSYTTIKEDSKTVKEVLKLEKIVFLGIFFKF